MSIFQMDVSPLRQSIEQRAVIRFLALKGAKAKAIQAELQSVYGQMPAN
jgi:hypothetical protein